MGKVGSIFRDARLGKGLTMEQVSDETNISKRFLQGIEADNFDGFPGEVYILGFLRNYAEFLGLDAAKIIERYRQSDKEDEQATGQTLSSDAGDASDQGKEVKEAPAPAQVPVSTPAPAPTRTPAPSAQPAAEKTDKTDNEEASAPPQAQESSLFSEMEGQERMEGQESPPSASSASPKKRKTSSNRKSRTKAEPHEGEAKVQGEPQSPQSPQSATIKEPSVPMQARQTAEPPPSSTHRGTSTRRVTLVQAGRLLPFILLGLVLLIAAISIIPTLKLPSGTNRTPSEYHAEGLPFEQRLYPQDKVYLPLGDDFISITLRAITDKISLDTPYGTLMVGLNEDAVMNPSVDQERLVATVLDYAPNEPKTVPLCTSISKSHSLRPKLLPTSPYQKRRAELPHLQPRRGRRRPSCSSEARGGLIPSMSTSVLCRRYCSAMKPIEKSGWKNITERENPSPSTHRTALPSGRQTPRP